MGIAYSAGLEKPFRYYGMFWPVFCIRFIRFLVWAHHMFSVGMDTDSKAYFSAATVVIRVPTRVKVFRWCAHLNSASIELTSEIVWAVLSSASIDLLLHDTYYVVAHFHYVLSMGAVASLVMGVYFWAPLFSGVSPASVYAYWFLGLFFFGVNITFMPMHTLGMKGFPRRYSSYSYGMTNTVRMCSLGAVISIFATFIGLFTLNPALTTLNVWVKYATNGDASFFHGFACKSHTNLEMPHLAHYPNTRVKWPADREDVLEADRYVPIEWVKAGMY